MSRAKTFGHDAASSCYRAALVIVVLLMTGFAIRKSGIELAQGESGILRLTIIEGTSSG